MSDSTMANYERMLAVLKEVEPYICQYQIHYGEYWNRDGNQMRVNLLFESVALLKYWKKELEERELGWSIQRPYVLYTDNNALLYIHIKLSQEEYAEASRREAEESCLTITKYSKS